MPTLYKSILKLGIETVGKNFYCTKISTNSIKMAGSKVLKRMDVIKSPEDLREYRGLELVNKLKVLIVSDPTTDKSAAALDVNIGFMSDPDKLPGLAHFCEHMLFLGTEKYPIENEYTKFLSQHGGSSNACTYADHTKYFFDVVPEKLEPALDRFAQFFIAPLFTEDVTDRELNAVNSEHEKNIPNDTWRLDQLDKHTGDPKHPYSKFGTGNKDTLDTIPKEQGINVRDELLKFHDKWYSSNIMALCVLGKEPLDEIEDMVVRLFSDIKNKDVTSPRWDDHPFTDDYLKLFAKIVPIKDVRNLNITFPIPDLHEYYKSGPGNYISHLIGHEGPGSLLSALKARGWSSNLFGGFLRPSPRGFGFFGVSMDLTEEGMDHINDIIVTVFQYINLLKSDEPQKWIFEEQKNIMAMHFHFKDKEVPISFVANHVHNLQEYPMNEVLSGGYLLEEWRPELITQVLEYLKPEKSRVAIVAQKYANRPENEREPWYGTEYSLSKISDETIQNWNSAGFCSELHLPPVNEFIPTDFSLRPKDDDITQHPAIIYDSSLIRLWFKQDDEYKLPKATVRYDFVSPLAYLDPLNYDLTHLFVVLFRDSLNEYAYAAEIAGLKWDLANTKYGMVLAVNGYSSKLHILLERVIGKLVNFEIDPKRFDIMKENYTRELKNFTTAQPYQHAVYYLAMLLTESAWNKEELLAALDQVTVERLKEFIPSLLSKLHIEGLIHGNFNKADALQLGTKVEEQINQSFAITPLLPRQLVLNREIDLDDGCNYLYEIENNIHRSSCTSLYYQCGMQKTESNMLLELFLQIISEPCYDILRTKEQLGYMVFSGLRRSNGVQGLRIIVQSDRHPNFVDSRIEEFLKSMLDYITNMPDEEFKLHKDALAAQRLEKPKRLSGLSARFWNEISNQQYNFDRAQIEVAYLLTITKLDIINFFENFFLENAKQRNKLAVHVLSTAEGGAGKIDNNVDANVIEQEARNKITDPNVFKSTQSMFPLVQPYIEIVRKGSRSKL
ncbi:insulin-degrading enzyme [Chrysoperla carnea]|uniref:insulin-degrading enzyme n=1 Tax=Chrysoperla carnea TaxID=189513 RepID=UPI001D084665|nr:insulin-degrading enzyme [Chrysoperla carnea]